MAGPAIEPPMTAATMIGENTASVPSRAPATASRSRRRTLRARRLTALKSGTRVTDSTWDRRARKSSSGGIAHLRDGPYLDRAVAPGSGVLVGVDVGEQR